MSTGAVPRAQRSRARRRTRITATITAAAIVVLGCAGGYAAITANAAIPSPVVTLDPAFKAAALRPVSADPEPAQQLVDAQQLPTAIGWADGDEVWSNDDTAYPLGSITKLITVLVCMEKSPLEAGADGETYTWTEADRALTKKYQAMDGVAYDIPVGTQLTQRDMMKFIFLPSANDYAHAYALHTFGSNEAFLAALDEFTEKHGLESVSLVEPTGMHEDDRASAADLVRIARLALDNPTIREFNGMKSADMPWGIGTIENSNPLLGVMPGVIGTKTGTLDAVGYNFIASQEAELAGRDVINISVTLARPSYEARAASGREVLTAMAELPQQVEVVAKGTVVGTVSAADGSVVELVTAEPAAADLLPGEQASLAVELAGVGAGAGSENAAGSGDGSLAAGSAAGIVRVTTPDGEVEVPVVTRGAIATPDFWWKLAHPELAFG